MSTVSKATLVLSGQTGGLRRAMSRAQRTMRSAASGIKRRAKRMGRAVAAAMAAGGAAMLAFAAKSTQMAARFEKNMVKVNTLVGLSRERVRGMRDDVLALAAETGQAPTKLAKALFRLTSGGIRGAEALQSLRKAAQAARIGMGEVNELARIATSSVQAFGKQGEDMNSVLNTLFATIREGNVKVDRLQSAFGFVQSIAADVGVTIQDLGAFFAVTSRTMGDTNKAARALRQFLVRLQDPSDSMREAFQAAGTSVAEIRRQIQDEGLPRTLVNLAEAAEQNGVAFAKIVQSSRALPALLTAARGNAEDFLKISDRMSESQSEFSRAVEETSKTLSDQIERLKAVGRAALIQFGERFAPAVSKLVTKVRQNMPQITATIARVMADTISAIRSVLSFVDGAVKEMAVGGLIGFLFMGAPGAAIGGIIGKVIAEQKTRILRLVENLGLDKLFDIKVTPVDRALIRVQELRDQMQQLALPQLRAAREDLGSGPEATKRFLQAQRRVTRLQEKIKQAQSRVQELLQSDQAAGEQKGFLGRMADEAKLLEDRLRHIAQQGGLGLPGGGAGRGGGGGGGLQAPSLFPAGSLAPISAMLPGAGGGGGLPAGLGLAAQSGFLTSGGAAAQIGGQQPDISENIGLGKLSEKGKTLGAKIKGQLVPAFSTLITQVTGASSKLGKFANLALQVGQKLLSGAGPVGIISGALTGFAGFFQSGGTIPRGQFGIVGENGPEPVAGPATVFPNETMAATGSGGTRRVEVTLKGGGPQSRGTKEFTHQVLRAIDDELPDVDIFSERV